MGKRHIYRLESADASMSKLIGSGRDGEIGVAVWPWKARGADNSPIRPNRRFAPFVWLIDQLRLRPYTSTASVPDLAAAQFR